MQVVIREYGGSIICAVCLVFLTAFLFLHFGSGDTIRDASEAFSKSSGNTLNVRVLQIFDPDGVRMTSSILTFPREGIYRIRLWAEDEKGHAGTEEVYVGVRP